MTNYSSRFGRLGDSEAYGNGHQSPEEIEHEIELTQQRMEQTIEAIRHDLSPGQIVDQAIHWLKEGRVGGTASGFADSLSNTIKENPVPVALVGIGLTWLAVSSRGSSRARTSSVDETGFGVAGSLERREGIEGAEPGGLESAREKARDIADSAREKTAELKERAATVSHEAGERAREAKSRVQGAASRARESSSELWESQPLVVGAIAVGVGALLGALLPSTPRERRALGPTRDELLGKASEEGARMLGEARAKLGEVRAEKLEQRPEEPEPSGLAERSGRGERSERSERSGGAPSETTQGLPMSGVSTSSLRPHAEGEAEEARGPTADVGMAAEVGSPTFAVTSTEIELPSYDPYGPSSTSSTSAVRTSSGGSVSSGAGSTSGGEVGGGGGGGGGGDVNR